MQVTTRKSCVEQNIDGEPPYALASYGMVRRTGFGTFWVPIWVEHVF